MSFRVIVLGGLLMMILNKLSAQTENDAVVEAIIESVAENAGEDFDYSELVERLNFYRKNPINLNKTGRDKLEELMFLSPLQINQLLAHRGENGNFLELYELQSIDALDLETIKKLLPFITLGENNPLQGLTFKSLLQNGSNDVLFTYGQVIQRQQGYASGESSSKYLGSPQRFLTRYRYHYGQHLSAAITMEKDAGEGFFSGKHQYGFDFYSGSLFYKNDGKIKKVALGDYSLQFGQGLTLWSGLSFSKGAAITTAVKNDIGLKAYTSTNEALFLRGFASTLNFKMIEVTPFISYRQIDAGISRYEQSDEGEVTSLSQSGLHRTANEISKRNNLSQLLYGANVQYNGKALKVGSVAYQTSFNKSFEEGVQPYNRFEFSGNRLSNIGLYYNYAWRNIYFFGEAAHSLNSGSAYLNGAMASLTSKVALVLFQRNYAKNYHSFFNQALSEGSNAVNEKGLYSGLVITPNRKYELSAYADFFRFPWLRFQADAPSSGYELLTQFTYSPNKKIKTMARYKLENKQENDGIENALNFLEDVRRQNFRVEINYKINGAFQLRNRAEAVVYQKGNGAHETGFILFQDVVYNPMKSKLTGNFRIGLFDTQSFNTRIYAYESDVLYGFSAPAYQNKGIRFYANSRYKINKRADLWCRYAISSYSNIDEVGSGGDKISGNNKSDFKVQLRLQF